MYTNSIIIFGDDTMCTKSELNIITSAVAEKAKRLLGDKLDAVILYGSYARGDYGSDLSLEYGITVSLLLYKSETYNRYKNAMPFLINVQKDGVKVA